MLICGHIMLRFSIILIMTASVVANAAQPWAGSRQCLVVITESWTSPAGKLSMLERDDESASWRRRGSAIEVRVGRAGLAWGRGLTDTANFAGPVKKEGDDKAPAGVFRLGTVFGSKRESKMPFAALSRNLVAVDDPSSRYYNQLIDQTKIDRRDWKHAEQMFGVSVYKRGVVVEHNTPAKAGAGSCIFLHVWESPATSTSGCTAMPEQELAGIIRWLDPARHPLLVQLPRPVYEKLLATWKLPTL